MYVCTRNHYAQLELLVCVTEVFFVFLYTKGSRNFPKLIFSLKSKIGSLDNKVKFNLGFGHLKLCSNFVGKSSSSIWFDWKLNLSTQNAPHKAISSPNWPMQSLLRRPHNFRFQIKSHSPFFFDGIQLRRLIWLSFDSIRSQMVHI